MKVQYVYQTLHWPIKYIDLSVFEELAVVTAEFLFIKSMGNLHSRMALDVHGKNPGDTWPPKGLAEFSTDQPQPINYLWR